ncbi:putative H/ACA ribonucleoprotein complex, subunit Gar1/Naf1 [Helianthus annuus]|nr:putative H/ACA ribonucleoprotein complex, subunit Gar1/Naf1 [Helianthus annuus]
MNTSEEVCGSKKLGDLIEEQIGKVCLTSDAELKEEVNNNNNIVDGVSDCPVDNGEVKTVVEDSEEEEDESSSSSSSSSDDDDDSEEEDDDSEDESDEEEGVKGEGEMEEGEVKDEVIAWSDADDEDTDVVKGPIRSKNEVQDLPPVPPVTVTIQPHHQTLPVGAVLSVSSLQIKEKPALVLFKPKEHEQGLYVKNKQFFLFMFAGYENDSIMGSQVVVEGVEVHNPLSEGSILWITESRSPLGVVDEIFGPVKNPYYIVRYNSETEIPTGLEQGSLISFVPEFADHVLNNNNLYKKGYDASGENDEELSEELEFSDDEKEAEYKRMMKMAKRGSAGEKNGRMKKDKKSKNRGGNWKNDQQPSSSGPNHGPTSGPNHGPNNGPNHGPNNGPNHGPNNGPTSRPTSGPYAFSQAPNIPSGVWPFGFSPIQPQNLGFPPNGLPSNVPPFMQQNFIQQPFQNPQFNTPPGQMFPGNFSLGVPPNFGAFVSWPSGMPQNNFNQSQMGPPMVFAGLPQGVAMPNQLQMENNNSAVRPFVAVANGESSQKFNQGNGFSNRGGRKPFQRGGGRFRGGRSGPRSG